MVIQKTVFHTLPYVHWKKFSLRVNNVNGGASRRESGNVFQCAGPVVRKHVCQWTWSLVGQLAADGRIAAVAEDV